MKKLVSLIFAACAAIATTAHAAGAVQSSIHLTDSPSDAFIGDSIDWNVKFGKDPRDVVFSPRGSSASATDMIFLTPGGPAVYDIAKNGAATPNNDRRIVQDGGTLELAPVRVSILELPREQGVVVAIVCFDAFPENGTGELERERIGFERA